MPASNEPDPRKWTNVLRHFGEALGSVMPPMRSKKGTYGTQRTESAASEQQRRESYPHD
jgi:hypothetical protein